MKTDQINETKISTDKRAYRKNKINFLRKRNTSRKKSAELTKQEEFVKKHRRHHHEISSWRTILFALFLALWEISADLNGLTAFSFPAQAGW